MSLIMAAQASASDLNDAYDATKIKMQLRTADQYDLWKYRVANACWTATRMDVFEVTQEQVEACNKEMKDFEKGKNKEFVKPFDWVAKCWNLLTSTLHDDLLVKLRHVPRGAIPSLVQEIRTALTVENAEDLQSLRIE